ncbi:MAG: hypothetical protein GY762_17650 [Proteobacteria bacterium]|nr:hypothetical protein [Pseudomonadota bacterium]
MQCFGGFACNHCAGRQVCQRHLYQLTLCSITLVMDNARCQRCNFVRDLTTASGIAQFLSPYSPNLNLIERLWMFIKKR